MRIGIDLGGTKIAGVVLDGAGQERARRRVPTPQGDYAGTLAAVAGVVEALEADVGRAGLPVGIGTPGTLDPDTELLRGCNSTCLNDRPFAADLRARLRRPLALANDANCLALSEAVDGAGAGAGVVFAVILGTGVGGALVVRQQIVGGRHGIGGEWGHTPLPGLARRRLCWCGRWDCVESHLAGPALARRGGYPDGRAVGAALAAGDAHAAVVYEAWLADLGRALAVVVNIADPDVIVFGGGLSQLPGLYTALPAHIAPHAFTPALHTALRPAQHGDDSGVRGAARLVPEEDEDA